MATLSCPRTASPWLLVCLLLYIEWDGEGARERVLGGVNSMCGWMDGCRGLWL